MRICQRHQCLPWFHRLILVVLVSAACVPSARANVVRTEYFTIEPQDGLEAMAKELARRADRIHRTVAAQLGTLDTQAPLIHVKLLRGQDALAQELNGASIAEWAAGVAFPKRGLILLRIDAQTQIDHLDVFQHEVSHIALSRAVRHAHLPHWFVEGVAVHQAGERLVERWSKAANATLTDSLVPLEMYSSSFPRDGTRANLAYAESTAFVAYLLKRLGWRGIRATVQRVATGEPFPTAFAAIYGAPVARIEQRWHSELASSASWLRLFGDSSLMWTLASLLFLVSWWVQRRKNQRRLKLMDHDEDEDEFA